MRTKPICVLGVLLSSSVLLGTGVPAYAGWVWRSDTGFVSTATAPKAPSVNRYKHACALMTQGNYPAALEQFDAIQRATPARALKDKVRFNMAECLFHMGKYQKAAAITSELPLEGGSVPARDVTDLAWRTALAIKRANRSLAAHLVDRLPPVSDETRLEDTWTPSRMLAAAELCLDVQRPESALKLLKLLRQKWPDSKEAVTALRLLGESYLRLAMQQYRKGELPRLSAQAFAEYADRNPEIPQAGRIREYIPLLQRISRERSIAMRRVLYAAVRFHQGDADSALEVFSKYAEGHAGKPTGELGHYFLVRALKRKGKLRKAVEACRTFRSRYPASSYSGEVAGMFLELGRMCLERGDKAGIDIMERIFQSDPGGPLADDALLEKAKHLLNKERYPAAATLFKAVLEDYAETDNSAEALFRLGQAILAQSIYHPTRQDIYSKARECFELYLRRYPHGRFAPSARSAAARCREKQAEHLVEAARFYRRQGRPGSANIYFGIIKDEYPDSEVAKNLQVQKGDLQ